MGTMRTGDTRIHDDVIAELAWDTRIDSRDVNVVVSRGIVTLTGTVKSYAEKMLAQLAAHRVAGVRDVANDIQVSRVGYQARSDSDIAYAVRQTLVWDVLVPDDRITSTVTDGLVTLEGTVDTFHQRQDAERAVRDLVGVRGVNNRVRVEGPTVDAETIRASIGAALERRAKRESKHLHIAVRDGAVTLNGAVQSWEELEAVVNTARHTPGVRSIDDKLTIAPFEQPHLV